MRGQFTTKCKDALRSFPYSFIIKELNKFFFMSFFKHVQLHEYDITDKGISQACYDEMKRDGYILPEDELRVLADYKREQFKEYMRPLFA